MINFKYAVFISTFFIFFIEAILHYNVGKNGLHSCKLPNYCTNYVYNCFNAGCNILRISTVQVHYKIICMKELYPLAAVFLRLIALDCPAGIFSERDVAKSDTERVTQNSSRCGFMSVPYIN